MADAKKSKAYIGPGGVFRGLSPSTVETFAELLVIRFHQSMRFAVESLRDGEIRRGFYFLGICRGMVDALYDVNVQYPYRYSKAVDKVSKLGDRIGHQLTSNLADKLAR